MSHGWSRDRWEEYLFDRIGLPLANAVVYQAKGKTIAKVWSEQRERFKRVAQKKAGVNDTKVIQITVNSLPNGGSVFLASGTFNITDTIVFPENINMMVKGAGYSTILKGSASPLMKLPASPSGKIQIYKMKIEITSDNIGIKAEQSWTASPKASVDIRNVWFYAAGSAGILLDIYGTRESSISECWFSGASAYGDTDIGINLRGDENGGAMNLSINDCHFWHIQYAVKAYTTYRPHLAGIRISDCTVIGCQYPIDAYNVNDLAITNSMIDNNYYGLILDSVSPFRIIGNYLQCKKDGVHVIHLKSTEGLVRYFQIIGNVMHSGAETRGDGIHAETTGNHIQYGIIESNSFTLLDTCINLLPADGVVNNVIIKENIFLASSVGINIQDVSNLIITNNRFEVNVTNPITGTPLGTNIISNNLGYTTENSGTATFSGDGSTTQFKIEHGLVSTPSKVLVTPMSADAAGDFYVTADDTYIYVNYKSAPPSGTDNVKLNWCAEV